MMRGVYGWGVFETMRFINRRSIYFSAHIERLKKSCRVFGFNFHFTSLQLKRLIGEELEKSGGDDVYLKLIRGNFIGGNNFQIIAKTYIPPTKEKYEKGFSVCVSAHKQGDAFLANHKITQRFNYELAYDWAKNNNFDEAVILNANSYLCEASRSNIFFIKDNRLFTPGIECGCLPGVTRKAVFDIAKKINIPATEGNFTIEDILSSQGAFLTNSLIGIMPLVKINNIPINRGVPHLLVHLLAKHYHRLLA